MTIARLGLVFVALLPVGRLAAGQIHGPAAGSAPESATSAPTIVRESQRPRASSPAETGLDRAVAELADARWEIRRAAGFKLIDAGEAGLPALRRAYQESRSHEVQLRIRELAEAIFSENHVPQTGAFLGVRQRPRIHQTDPRVPAGTMWVEILQVFRDTAADRAGLHAGDLVVRCEDKPFPEDPTGQVFGLAVSRHRPGTEISLDVLRGTAEPITLRVKLGCRPMAVLAEADPEAYATVHAAFEDWWQSQFTPPTSDSAESRPTATRRVRGGSRR